LRLEVGKPEELSIDALVKDFANLSLEIVVDDVFQIYRVKIVSPWMQNLEAVAGNVLRSILLDIVFEELDCGLVSLEWVAQVVIIDLLVCVSQERANSLDARGALQVLAIDELF
jgi:hypothetical protein